MARPCVPWANASSSNTPSGPFQMIVPASLIKSVSAWEVAGPTSRIISSGRTSSARRSVGLACAEISVATTTSIGNGSVAPLSASVLRTLRHSGTRSASTSDFPIGKPSAIKNVLAMPPPTISRSTLCARLFRMVSLVDTLEPATMATSGRFGCPRACRSASSSAASSGPAQATGAKRAMPWVVASARCAVPNASFTYTSHNAAMRRDSSSLSFFSPGLTRQFSSSTT